MFATNPALRLEIPSALLNLDVWDSLEFVMLEPVLVVTTSQRTEDGIHASRTFLAKARHLESMRRSRKLRVKTVDLISPSRVNGSGGWKLDRLKEVWKCRDVAETQTCWLFSTESGSEFSDSLHGCPPSALVRELCVFSVTGQRKRSGIQASGLEQGRRGRSGAQGRQESSLAKGAAGTIGGK